MLLMLSIRLETPKLIEMTSKIPPQPKVLGKLMSPGARGHLEMLLMLGRGNTPAPALQPGAEVYMTVASVFLCLLCFDELSPGPREQAEVSGENM